MSPIDSQTPQWVWMNGAFVPPAQAVVSVFDRSFQLGDGLFEAVRVCRGQPFQWNAHWQRLARGADVLKLRLPYAAEVIEAAARELIARHGWPEAMLRIQVSRGVGQRGYSTRGADHPVVVLTLYPFHLTPTAGWRLMTSRIRLPADDPVGNFKNTSKAWQIVARMEAEAAGVDEALLLDTNGHVAEAAGSNVFWIEGDAVCTPPLSTGALAGVTRAVVVELCRSRDWPIAERRATPGELAESDGAFLTLSSHGVLPILELDGRKLKSSPRIATLAQDYRALEVGTTVAVGGGGSLGSSRNDFD